jgi:hypothetical protein
MTTCSGSPLCGLQVGDIPQAHEEWDGCGVICGKKPGRKEGSMDSGLLCWGPAGRSEAAGGSGQGGEACVLHREGSRHFILEN